MSKKLLLYQNKERVGGDPLSQLQGMPKLPEDGHLCGWSPPCSNGSGVSATIGPPLSIVDILCG